MAQLYADENFPSPVVTLLRALGHDVLTAQEAGNANLGVSDEDLLAFAITLERAVLTNNRQDFIRLHRLQSNHAGIIVCTEDFDFERLASQINDAIDTRASLERRTDSGKSSFKMRGNRSTRSPLTPITPPKRARSKCS